MRKNGLFASFFCLTLLSCDCYFQSELVILDEMTQKPVKGVNISQAREENISRTSARFIQMDSAIYLYSEISRKCPDKRLFLQKGGYETLKVVLKQNSRDTVYLTPEKGVSQVYRDTNNSFSTKFLPLDNEDNL